MSFNELLDLLEIDLLRLSGKPVIRSTRIPVKYITDLLKSGADIDYVLETYPQLSRRDIELIQRNLNDLECILKILACIRKRLVVLSDGALAIKLKHNLIPIENTSSSLVLIISELSDCLPKACKGHLLNREKLKMLIQALPRIIKRVDIRKYKKEKRIVLEIKEYRKQRALMQGVSSA